MQGQILGATPRADAWVPCLIRPCLKCVGQEILRKFLQLSKSPVWASVALCSVSGDQNPYLSMHLLGYRCDHIHDTILDLQHVEVYC
jgi:hypothetical protein